MKSLIIFLTLFVAVRSNDVFLGFPDATSKLIYSRVHQENPAIWIRSETFTVNCSRNEVINAVKILDLRQDKWGDAYVKSGGIGQEHVTIELDSPSVFRGYNFLVEVWSIAIQTNNFFSYHGK